MVERSRGSARRLRRVETATTAAFVAALLALSGGQPTPAAAATFAPASQPGPGLTVSPVQARRALRCSPGLRKAARTPVLLSPGTGVTGAGQYRYTWQPALDRLGIPWCTLTPPHMTLGDIQVTGEYLVAAIRSMHERAGRRIAILGHSQGGMSMRWALRFWPDTRAMVADVIGLAGNNHGSAWQGRINAAACAAGCPPVNLQQVVGSRFLRALNSRAETFRGIAYTEITTDHDEVLQNAPPACTSCLSTGSGKIANVSVQRICPTDPTDHAGLATDLVAYRLVLDALRHSGPARASRIPRSVCGQLADRAANPLIAQTPGPKDTRGLQLVVCGAPCNAIGAPMVTREPTLARYVYARPRSG